MSDFDHDLHASPLQWYYDAPNGSDTGYYEDDPGEFEPYDHFGLYEDEPHSGQDKFYRDDFHYDPKAKTYSLSNGFSGEITAQLVKLDPVRDWLCAFYHCYQLVSPDNAGKYCGLWGDLEIEKTIRIDNLGKIASSISQAYANVQDPVLRFHAHAEGMHALWKGEVATKVVKTVIDDAKLKQEIYSKQLDAITKRLNDIPAEILDVVNKKVSTIIENNPCEKSVDNSDAVAIAQGVDGVTKISRTTYGGIR